MINLECSLWQILAQMRQSFEVETIAEDAETFPEDADILMVIHPTGLAENLLRKIDQWALAGKNLMIFVDPHCEFAAPDPSVAIQQGVAPDPQTSSKIVFVKCLAWFTVGIQTIKAARQNPVDSLRAE